ncbi:MAG: MlaD family protein [Alphaproteobacteria bacterium]
MGKEILLQKTRGGKIRSLLLLALFVFLLFYLIGRGGISLPNFLSGKMTVETYFTGTVDGLAKGSPIKYHGIKVGSVKKINFAVDVYDSSENNIAGQYVVVVSKIDPDIFLGKKSEDRNTDIEKLVQRGMRFSVVPSFRGNGQSSIRASFRKPNKRKLAFPWEPKHAYIPSTSSRMADLLVGDSAQSQDILIMMKAIDHLAETVQTQPDPFMAHPDMDTLVKDMSETFAVAKTVLAGFKETEFGQMMGGGEQGGGVFSATKLVSKGLPGTIKKANEVLAKLSRTVNQTDGDIQDIETDLKLLLGQVGMVLNNVERYPAFHVFGEEPPMIEDAISRGREDDE